MYVRVTRYQMKPDAIPTATALLEQIKDQVMGLPGVLQFINSINQDGHGCVMSINESEELSESNSAAVQAIWQQFGEHLMSPPEASGYNVIVNWKN